MVLPKPTGEFDWVQESWGASLSCRALSRVARHVFSTTQLPLEGVRDEDGRSWTALAHSMGLELSQLARLRQVHSACVVTVASGTRPPQAYDEWPQADAAMTGDPRIGVSVRAADCVPVLLADPESGAVAAVHAGWRGTASGASVATVKAMAGAFAARPENLIAAVGPSIGPCCYEVGDELKAQFTRYPEAATWFSDGEKPHLDLWRATRDQLAGAGLAPANIHVCELCTSHHPDLFYSFRRDGARAGRLVAAIRPGFRSEPDKRP